MLFAAALIGVAARAAHVAKSFLEMRIMRATPVPMAVDEALRATSIVIDVPARESETIGLRSERFSEAFCIANVRSFDEMQVLGLVPRGFSEHEARLAVAEDDREHQARTRELQQARAGSSRASGCGCEGEKIKVSRRRTQANLSALLPEHFRRAAEGADASAAHVYQHLRRWLDKPAMYLVGLVRAQGIVVREDSLLVMDAAVSLVNASFINIFSGGRLKFLAGSVNVRCDSLNGPASDEDPPPYHPPIDNDDNTPIRWPPIRSGDEIAAKHLPGYYRASRGAKQVR